jgi:outer membrane immunogenic protein
MARPGAVGYVAPVNWSGFYFGVHSGYSWADVDSKFIAGTVFDVSTSGGIYGGHIGLQRQLGVLVLGVETGLSGFFGDNEGNVTCPDPQFTCRQRFEDTLFTVGVRAGVPVGHLMPYVTLGYANAKLGYSAVGPDVEVGDTRHHGTYIGAGLDWMIRSNWVLGAEYRSYRFHDDTRTPTIVSLTPPIGPPHRYTSEATADSFLLRLSYQFGHRAEVVPLK